MKRIIIFWIAVLLTAGLYAQSPEKMSYQAVLRDTGNHLVTDQPVGVRVSILQGSVSGSAVYEEIFNPNPSTNANGLLTLEIGAGTPVFGTFAAIDWSGGSFFIKTEIDLTGGTDYTITSASQLLSVPYALYAKTAETVSGTIPETDPVFTSSEANNITAADITHLGNLSGTNTGDQDLSGFITTETDPVFKASEAANIKGTDITNLKNLSGINTGDQDISGIAINRQAIKDSAAHIRAEFSSLRTYAVGDFAQGGVVFWVDETGRHGLVCAIQDQSTAIRWYAGTNGNTQATGDGPFAGKANTWIIIAVQAVQGDDGGLYAARLCNLIQLGGGEKTYGDWYLPSKEELNLMYQNKSIIDSTAVANGGEAFSTSYYWSSNEYSAGLAWTQVFGVGSQWSYAKEGALRVRAVRAF